MPTYLYETIPNDAQTKPRQFEVRQRMNDAPLTEDPLTGEPVRRIITGGVGIKLKGLKRSTTVRKSSPASTPCSCASSHRHSHHRHYH